MSLRHVAPEFHEESYLQRRLPLLRQTHADRVALAQQFHIAGRRGKLLHRHVFAEQRNRLAGFGCRQLNNGFDLGHAFTHDPAIGGGLDGDCVGCRLLRGLVCIHGVGQQEHHNRCDGRAYASAIRRGRRRSAGGLPGGPRLSAPARPIFARQRNDQRDCHQRRGNDQRHAEQPRDNQHPAHAAQYQRRGDGDHQAVRRRPAQLPPQNEQPRKKQCHLQRAAERAPGFRRHRPCGQRQRFLAHVQDFGERELHAAARYVDADRPDTGQHRRGGSSDSRCRGGPADAAAQAATGPLQRGGKLVFAHRLHAAVGEQHVPVATLPRR